MSAENVELARRGFELFNRHDVEGFVAMFDPDAVARNLEGDIDDRVYRGPDGIREYVQRWLELFDSLRAEPEEFVAVGDFVVVPFRLSGVARQSGLPVDLRAVYVIGIRNGRGISWTPYLSQEDAMAAVRAALP